MLRSIATIVILVITVLMVGDQLGLNMAPVLASAGIGGVALGFGAQSLVKDFLSGMFMLAEDQYGVGDVIDVGTASVSYTHLDVYKRQGFQVHDGLTDGVVEGRTP